MCRELPLLILQVLGERLGSQCPFLGRRKKLSVKSLIEIFTQCNDFLGSGMDSYHVIIDILRSGVESVCLASVERNGRSQVDSFKLIMGICFRTNLSLEGDHHSVLVVGLDVEAHRGVGLQSR